MDVLSPRPPPSPVPSLSLVRFFPFFFFANAPGSANLCTGIGPGFCQNCMGSAHKDIVAHFRRRAANGTSELMPRLKIGTGNADEDDAYCCFAEYSTKDEPMAKMSLLSPFPTVRSQQLGLTSLPRPAFSPAASPRHKIIGQLSVTALPRPAFRAPRLLAPDPGPETVGAKRVKLLVARDKENTGETRLAKRKSKSAVSATRDRKRVLRSEIQPQARGLRARSTNVL